MWGILNKSNKKGKSARKSNNITETPARLAVKIIPNARKASEREQDQAKKLRHARKQGLLDFFRKRKPSAKCSRVKK